MADNTVSGAAESKSSRAMTGSGSGGIGIGFAVIIAWVLGEYGVDMPVEVQAALGGVLVWAFERLGGYLAR